MTKCAFIYNPASGRSKKIIKNLKYIKKTIKEKFDVVDVYRTKSPKHATVLAKLACDKYDRIIFSGGDGTFNEVIQGVSTNEKKPPLGYVPSGTVCDMAKNLGIPMSLKKSLDIALNGKIKKGDICKINKNYFANAAAFGTYVNITFDSKNKLKQKIGKIAYYIELLKNTFHVKKAKVKLWFDDKYVEEETILLLLGNAKKVGGFTINKEGSLRDGLMDIIIIKESKFFKPLSIFKLFAFGVHKIKNKKYEKIYSTKKVRIQTEENVLMNIDGEKSDKRKDFLVEILNEHVEYIVDESRCRFLG